MGSWGCSPTPGPGKLLTGGCRGQRKASWKIKTLKHRAPTRAFKKQNYHGGPKAGGFTHLRGEASLHLTPSCAWEGTARAEAVFWGVHTWVHDCIV